MTGAASLTLFTWLSPGYPVGAFSYSHGLERAIDTGAVRDGASLAAWVGGVLAHGGGWADAVLLAGAWASDAAGRVELCALARALAPSRERLLETEAMGAAFARTTAAVLGTDPAAAPYPVALGAAAAAAGVAAEEVLPLFLHATAANLVSAGVRLIPLGQTEGQRILHGLAPLCLRLGAAALVAEVDDLGGAAILADIASMQHETQYTRLFRT